MTGTPLDPLTPANTPVWVEVGKGISLPGTTITAPRLSSVVEGPWFVMVELKGRERVYPLARVTRRAWKP